MGLFHRIKRSSASSSSANSTAPSSGDTTPTAIDNLSTSPASTNAPLYPLTTKQRPRLGLTKTLTWGRKSKEAKQRRRIESWEKEDKNEWDAPTARRFSRKPCTKKEQDVLRAFEWKPCRDSLDGGRSRSCFSGVSPGCSRMGSVDEGRVCEGSHLGREMSSSDTSREGPRGSSASREE